MSITKFKNAEGELISQVDVDSEKISAKSSKCSCINCETLSCFVKRKKAVENCCQCGICRDLVKSSSLSKKDSREDNLGLESATKKVIREVVTRETIESLKRVTETMYEFGPNENCPMIKERQLSDKKVIQIPTKSEISIKTECCKKRSKEDMNNIKECCKQRPILQTPSRDISQPHKEYNTATKLSAQIMNVPYEDLHESVPSSHEFTEQNPLSKLNIFKRIKEIYDACSCKVCECISNKPPVLRDDICECKPCQCQDCVKLRNKIEDKIRRIPHSGCPCIRCDRKDCRGITKNTYESQACDCGPSDTLPSPKKLSKHCKCEPCQCLNCKVAGFPASKAVKLGKVDAYIKEETCQCSPCECIECKQIYNRTNPTIMCTHSTDRSKFRAYCRCHNCRTNRCRLGEIETCKCINHDRPMRKTFHKNYNDYDIRTVIVDNKGPFNQEKEYKFENHNPIALYASLKNNYPSNSCNNGICKCIECECIVCSAKDSSLRNYRDHFNHNVMSVHSNIKLSTSITNACKCKPCECEICSKKNQHEDNIAFERKCRCDVCDCLHCDNASLATSTFPTSSTSHQSYNIHGKLPVKPIRSIEINKNCDCNPCDCRNCKKIFSCSSSMKFYSDGKSVERKSRRFKKVLLVSPSTSESRLNSHKKYVQSIPSATLSVKPSIEGVFRQDLSTCHAISHNYATVGQLLNTHKDEVCKLYHDSNGYNIVPDNDVDGEIFFKLNNSVLDTRSLKSIEDTPILNYPCHVTEPTFKSNKIVNRNQDRLNETKYKNYFNIIHEQSDKTTSNESNESLPIYWACCNEMSYPRDYSRNIKMTCKSTRPTLNDLSDHLIKNQYSESKHKKNYEKVKEKTTIQTFIDNNKSKCNDDFSEFVKKTYFQENFNNNFDEICLNHQQSHKNTDSFNASVEDNQGYKSSIINYSDITIDYERATKVLWEAKAFSSKLIKMLDGFETANKQFESASQKFKVLHESLLDINESELTKTHNNNVGKIPRISHLENKFGIISEVNLDNKQSVDVILKNVNEAEREYEKSSNQSEVVYDNYQYTEKITTNATPETKTGNKVIEKTNNIYEEGNVNIDTIDNMHVIQDLNTQSNFGTLNKLEILSTNNTSQTSLSESTHLDSSVTNLNKESKAETKAEANLPTLTIASVMNKLDSVFGDVQTTDTSIATDDIEKSLLNLYKQEDKQPWEIFKKNLFINDSPRDKKTIFQSPELELDIKEAIQAISLQTTTHNYAKVVPRTNEALANLQSEVNGLLNMPLLQLKRQFKCKTEPDVHLFPKIKLDLEVKSLSSTASSQTYDRIIERADKEVYFNFNSETNKVSCDELKATFIGLRRVSDHTVLVKWSVPKRLSDVQGYELLVDGRAVQKIFSPTRSMAVVTCLPHAARVLLTVRTITTDANCGHAPTSTIVYRPRIK